MLHEQIKNVIKPAMLTKDVVKLAVVRGLVAAFINELVATRRKPDEILTDDEVLAVIRRAAKQRQDSIKQFRLGGRDDLVQQETAELEIIKTYLPPEFNQEELKKLVAAKIKTLKITDQKDSGRVIGAVMKDIKGRADGNVIKSIVEKLLPK